MDSAAPGRLFPAIELSWPTRPADEVVERVLAELDDLSPSAVEEHPSGVRVFFHSAQERDRACHIVAGFAPDAGCRPLDVSDESWAERSQAALTAVRVGRVVVAPPWAAAAASAATDSDLARDEPPIVITIQPSMGFGTGHHESTRLCLLLLQALDLSRSVVLDVGTGSGVLAIGAWRLGAGQVIGLDSDPDALVSARENIELNHAENAVSVRALDIFHDSQRIGRTFDVITANLTGAVLERAATLLAALVGSGGALIVSGFQDDEAGTVAGRFESAGLGLSSRAEEARWVALCFRKFKTPL